MSRGKLFILSAPSGAGKSTVLKEVMARLENLVFSISHTTRAPRRGETDGVEYHFVDRPTFESMKEKGLFLEWAEVHGNYYGTSRPAVEKQVACGNDVILDIDVQGAAIIRGLGDVDAAYIFLAPPGLGELERRLQSRGLDDDETIATRMTNAEEEMAAMDEFEYCIVNETVDEAVRLFEAVILAERARGRRRLNGDGLRLEESA